MNHNERVEILTKTLKDFGGIATTNQIADKLGWNRNGVAQSMNSVWIDNKPLWSYHSSHRPTVWSLKKLNEVPAELLKKSNPPIIDDEPIHAWFELSYAQYLTIPRTVLQSMPLKWQQTFVRCLEELDDLIDWRPENRDCYYCFLKDGETGRFKDDPLADYERGRRQLPLNSCPLCGKPSPNNEVHKACSDREKYLAERV